jgi:hypothetical protein
VAGRMKEEITEYLSASGVSTLQVELDAGSRKALVNEVIIYGNNEKSSRCDTKCLEQEFPGNLYL